MGSESRTNRIEEECIQVIGGKAKPRSRRVDNTKMDLRDRMEWYVLD
jgi:hypothetical protein